MLFKVMPAIMIAHLRSSSSNSVKKRKPAGLKPIASARSMSGTGRAVQTYTATALAMQSMTSLHDNQSQKQ